MEEELPPVAAVVEEARLEEVEETRLGGGGGKARGGGGGEARGGGGRVTSCSSESVSSLPHLQARLHYTSIDQTKTDVFSDTQIVRCSHKI